MNNPNYLEEVRDQYEDYPYPLRDPEDERKRLCETFFDGLDKMNYYCFGGKKDWSKGFRALIAGGGTGDAAVYLAEQLRHTDADIIYIDISETSMEVAKKRAEIRGLKNITWIKDSLLNIPKLDLGKFDFINCSGVLHHLADPDEGLGVLACALKDIGAMGIMVYAPHGRAAIYQMQELMRLINKNEENRQTKVDNCKIVMQNLPDSNWFKMSGGTNLTDITKYGDIGIYDLLLHSQDRAYSVPQLYQFIESARLHIVQFLGNDSKGDYMYRPETYIEDKELIDRVKKFSLREQQSIAELVSGNVRRHIFYAVNLVQPVPTVEDLDNIPSFALRLDNGMYQRLYEASKQHEDALYIQESTTNLNINLKKTPNTDRIFKYIDGKRSLRQIFRKVMDSYTSKRKRPSQQQLIDEFKNILDEFVIPGWMFLRHSSVPQFRKTVEIQAQFTQTAI